MIIRFALALPLVLGTACSPEALRGMMGGMPFGDKGGPPGMGSEPVGAPYTGVNRYVGRWRLSEMSRNEMGQPMLKPWAYAVFEATGSNQVTAQVRSHEGTVEVPEWSSRGVAGFREDADPMDPNQQVVKLDLAFKVERAGEASASAEMVLIERGERFEGRGKLNRPNGQVTQLELVLERSAPSPSPSATPLASPSPSPSPTVLP